MASRRTLADCSVTLGVTGSIAAYKSAEIVRLLRRMGIAVRVVMTRAAERLMSAETLAALSQQPVARDLFRAPEDPVTDIDHLELGRRANLLLIAPATANILGKVAAGLADDLLSATIMASPVPVLFAPAMNSRMWASPIVTRNVATLRGHGFAFVGPASGELACQETGPGRMAEPEEVVDAAVKLLLATTGGMRVVVSAGPTEEPIDPVRVISNRSSGKMGAALAAAARDRGHRVTLVAGPLQCPVPLGVGRIDIQTATEMQRALEEVDAQADVLVMTAAVADYRVAAPRGRKIASGRTKRTLTLAPNPDILAHLTPSRAARGAVTIGFALEIGAGGERRAQSKLKAKGVDLIVLNDATQSHSAFGGDTTHAALLFRDGRIEHLPVMSKTQAAAEIMERAEQLHALKAGETTPGS